MVPSTNRLLRTPSVNLQQTPSKNPAENPSPQPSPGPFLGAWCRTAPYQARNKSTKINFLGPETARWGGGFPREGVVAEKFVPSLESLSSLGSKRGIWDVPGILPGCPGPPGVFKKFVQKKRSCAFFVPCLRRTPNYRSLNNVPVQY